MTIATRTAGPCQAGRRDDPATILTAAAPAQLSGLICAGCCTRHIPREVAL
jgi:hypothetical protein